MSGLSDVGAPRGSAPTAYEFRVGRHLDDHWAGWLENLTITRAPDGTTILRGPVQDQAELHGLLGRIRDLGTILISVQALDTGHPVITTSITRPGDDRSPHPSVP